jgi:hypothetical protein
MSTAFEKSRLSILDYLKGELISNKKHEFVDGMVHALADASTNHNPIATHSTVEIGVQLRGRKCQVFNSDNNRGMIIAPVFS